MVQNALRNEVNRLNEENDKLAQEIDDLEVQVQRVKEKEMQLENITKQQGINSQTFLELVNTNRKTVDELKVYVTQFLILYTVSPYFVFYLTSNCFCYHALSTKIAVQDDLTQTLVTACIDSDFDQSGHYSDQEIQILELRLQSIPGIIVNTAVLEQEIQKIDPQKRPIESILSLVQHLHRTDLSNEQRIFQFDETNIIVPNTPSTPSS
jgi:hypothetical protein